jgi:Pyridine nucleotide-disulphide oxidoreductase
MPLLAPVMSATVPSSRSAIGLHSPRVMSAGRIVRNRPARWSCSARGAIAEVAHQVLVKDFHHIDAHSARVLLIEGEHHLLAAFPAELAAAARRKLRRLGVEVRIGAHVEEVTANGVVVKGERIAAGTVIWAAGVTASPAGEWLGAKTDRAGRVLVRTDCTVPGHPEIYVIGDTASLAEVGTALPGVAPVAMQQGRYVTRAVCIVVVMRQDWCVVATAMRHVTVTITSCPKAKIPGTAASCCPSAGLSSAPSPGPGPGAVRRIQ